MVDHGAPGSFDPGCDGVGKCHLTALAPADFIFRQIGADIVHHRLAGRNCHAYVPAIWEFVTAFVGVGVFHGLDGIGGFGQGLVDHAVQFLPVEKVIVALEEDRHAGLGHQLVDGQFPARAHPGEFPGAVLALASPFVVAGELDATTPSAVHVMCEDEFVPGIAILQRIPEPLVLRVAQRDIPHIASLAVASQRIIHGD